MPTPIEIKTEIESGPLAGELSAFWADVFPTEIEPLPGDSNYTSAFPRWCRIKDRFGKLTPDAIYEILKILNDPTKDSKPLPIAVVVFTNFLARRGLLRKIKAAVNDTNFPSQIRDVCDLISTVTLSASDRMIDILDSNISQMIGAIVAVGIANSADVDALTSFCIKPCSRLNKLEWSINGNDLQEAKGI